MTPSTDKNLMNRRQFLQTGAAVAALSTSAVFPENVEAQSRSASDKLNPPGIRTAGIRMIPVVGGKYKVWTKRMGSGKTKVLLLHGGPAFTHNYLEAMESFLPEAGVEMYYYDQLGCGNSDIPEDSALWTLDRYCEEVEEVRRGLGLDHFVLYGQSWGGILALEYALKYQEHLAGLVISNMTAGMQSYLKRTDMLKRTLLSPERLAKLNAMEAQKDYDNPAYDQIMNEDLYPKMLCRIEPLPEPVIRAIRYQNEKIYIQMQGRSEFEVTGNLKDWERWDRLHEIKVRTLTIGATYDEMDPADMQKMATLMPNAISHICPKGSHLSMWDDQADYFRALLSYLKSL
jgi:proline iminopeptidase